MMSSGVSGTFAEGLISHIVSSINEEEDKLQIDVE